MEVPKAFDKDLYRFLTVTPQADEDVIHAAYKSLMKKYAPRGANDDARMAKELGEAHSILTKDRKEYDNYRKFQAKDRLIGPYKIIKEVAQGGFGTTYKAEHTVLKDFSCIKHSSEISPVAEEILKDEARSIWNLAHFGLPAMKDLMLLEDGSLALAMSWIEGPTLEKYITKLGKLDPEHVAWITSRILNTLSYLHRHEVLHGDIKPANIIVQPKKHTIVLVDYGFALIKPTAKSSSKGHTELFSPPEQMSPGKPLLPGSDFYSLGMTMIYALSGSLKAVESKQVPSNVPDPLCDFIRSLIVRNVLNRPERADLLFDEFAEIRKKSFGREHSEMKPLPDLVEA